MLGLAIATLLRGIVSPGQTLVGGGFGIDELLYADDTFRSADAPGRIAPMTALDFVLAGGTLGLLQLPDSKHDRIAQWDAALCLLIAIVACEVIIM